MKKQIFGFYFLCLLTPLFGATPYIPQKTTKNLINSQYRLHSELLLLSIQQHYDDEEIIFSPSFSYTKDESDKIYSGSFSLMGNNELDDAKLSSFINYTYHNLSSIYQTKSHEVSGGINLLSDSFVLLFANLGGGASFNEAQDLSSYNHYFGVANVGVGKDFDFFDDHFFVTPLLSLHYTFVHQKDFMLQTQAYQAQNYNALSLMAGLDFQFYFESLKLELFGFYNHSMFGDSLQASFVDKMTQSSTKTTLKSQKWLVYSGFNFTWHNPFCNLKLTLSNEFSKDFYNINAILGMGFDF